jgi:hypothetical protein
MSAGAKLHTYADLMTYIVRDAVTGRRLSYRGTLRQP